MHRPTITLLTALLVSLPLPAQTATPTPTPAEASIVTQIKSLRALPDADRGNRTGAIALEIRALPAGARKTSLALGLANRATEGDPGRDNLQAVTATLAQSLAETPIPDKNNTPAAPYKELAELVRYEHMTTTLTAPQLTEAAALLAAQDAEIAQQDFTLTDLHGKSWTFSQLRGKVVAVNFWATWCPPCRKEMPDLDALYTQFAPQGLVVLSISDEDLPTVAPFIAKSGYHPPVLLDPGDTVHKQFHVEGIPHTFVFARDGKLASQSIDMRTRGQFLQMLAQAGLHP